MDKKEFLSKVGKHIKEVRLRKGFTQAGLAKACLKDKQSIERVENGKTNPTIYYLYELSQVLDIPLSDLVSIK